MKISVVTTFPDKYWSTYGRDFVRSFCEFWPKEIDLYIVLDEDSQLAQEIWSMTKDLPRKVFINTDGSQVYTTQDKKDFMERNKHQLDTSDYRFQYVRFAHKVFAIGQIHEQYNGDFLIWLDGDTVTNRKIPLSKIKSWLPKDTHDCSFLGRKDWDHSECGWVAYKTPSRVFDKMYEMYKTDAVLDLSQWHDSYVFDKAREGIGCRNLSENIGGRDVWEHTELGEYMTHNKGNDKFKNFHKLNVKTKSCVDLEVLRENIKANLETIPKDRWVKQCRKHDEEMVICSAGPSLDPELIRPWYEKGVKILAVKHAMTRLLDAGIVPWGCILLDPRPHVKNFIENATEGVHYFVASQCEPSVVKTLLDQGASVYGWHALINTDFQDLLSDNDILVGGGSATSTRATILMEALGFNKFHLYGYDCCYFEKPDLNKPASNGKIPDIMEITMRTQSTDGEQVEKDFITEGQFLAQVQEFEKSMLKKDNIIVYGEDGIIPWIYNNYCKMKQSLEQKKPDIKEVIK